MAYLARLMAVTYSSGHSFRVLQVIAMGETLRIEVPGKPLHAYLPVGLFGSDMGLTSLAVTWRAAGPVIGPGALTVLYSVFGATLVAFIAVSLGYLVETMTAAPALRAEFDHPVAGSLFGTIYTLLLPLELASPAGTPVTGQEPPVLLLAQVFWMLGAAGMRTFAWFSVIHRMSRRGQLSHPAPTWIILVIGLLDIPLAWPVLSLDWPVERLLTMSPVVGLFFTVPIFTLVSHRLKFEDPLPPALKPPLMILGVPFSVCRSYYIAFTGTSDLISTWLALVGLFLFTVILPQHRFLPSCCMFLLDRWATGFPLAATSISVLRFAAASGPIAAGVALLVLVISTVIIADLVPHALLGLAMRELRTLST